MKVIKMTNYREIIRLNSLSLNNTQIAKALGISRTTVVQVLKQVKEVGLCVSQAKELSDREIAKLLYPPQDVKPTFKMPDYDYVYKELQRSGVTLNLLWLEYQEGCRQYGDLAYKSTQFNKYYNDYLTKKSATMHLKHKPGEIMQVDWAGNTAAVIDTDTGEIITAYVFVAVMPYSGYGYVEAFFSMDQESWTQAHINAFNFV